MYVDRFPLPLGLRHPVLCNLSGIYFRPTFYYQTFLGYNAPKTSWYLNRIGRTPFGDAFLTLLMTKFRLKLEPNWFRLEEDENLLNSLQATRKHTSPNRKRGLEGIRESGIGNRESGTGNSRFNIFYNNIKNIKVKVV